MVPVDRGRGRRRRDVVAVARGHGQERAQRRRAVDARRPDRALEVAAREQQGRLVAAQPRHRRRVAQTQHPLVAVVRLAVPVAKGEHAEPEHDVLDAFRAVEALDLQPLVRGSFDEFVPRDVRGHGPPEALLPGRVAGVGLGAPVAQARPLREGLEEADHGRAGAHEPLHDAQRAPREVHGVLPAGPEGVLVVVAVRDDARLPPGRLLRGPRVGHAADEVVERVHGRDGRHVRVGFVVHFHVHGREELGHGPRARVGRARDEERQDLARRRPPLHAVRVPEAAVDVLVAGTVLDVPAAEAVEPLHHLGAREAGRHERHVAGGTGAGGDEQGCHNGAAEAHSLHARR